MNIKVEEQGEEAEEDSSPGRQTDSGCPFTIHILVRWFFLPSSPLPPPLLDSRSLEQHGEHSTRTLGLNWSSSSAS